MLIPLDPTLVSLCLIASILGLTNVIVLLMWFQDKQSAREERKDLYDRLQAKDFVEYKEQTQVDANETEQQEDTVVDLDEAQNEIMGEDEDNG